MSVRADAIEVDVWDSVVSLFADLDRLEELLRIAQQEELAAMDPKIDELNAVEAMIPQTETDALEIGQTLRRASGLVLKSLEQRMKEVDLRYEALCKRRETLQNELNATQLTDTVIQGPVEFAQDVFVGIEQADFQTKRRNLEMLKVKVVVENGRFMIDCLDGRITGDIRKLPKANRWGIVKVLHLPTPSLPRCHFLAGRTRPGELYLKIHSELGG